MNRVLRALLVIWAACALGTPAFATRAPAESPPAQTAPSVAADPSGDLVAARKKKTKKSTTTKKKKKKKKGDEEEVPIEKIFETSAPGGGPAGSAGTPPATEAPVLDLSAPPPPEEDSGAGVLDLSNAGDLDAAKQELLNAADEPETDKKKKKPKNKDGSFDFGGGFDLGDLGGGEGEGGGIEFDFGIEEFDLGAVDLGSAEQERFDVAIASMSDEDYPTAAQEFAYFLGDPKYDQYKPESEYQLAKALYKLGFHDAALKRFQVILDQGASHRRYRKSVEWLFFISRKMADETPVLAELARFRNVKFPKAYQNEYRYLLAKYLFVQAERFEVERTRTAELIAGKKLEEEGVFNFESLGEMNFEQIASGEGSGFDFGDLGGGDTAFGAEAGSGEGGGGFDFGGGGGGKDAGGDSGGGFDFGAGGGDSGGGTSGGGFDFGAAADAPEGGEAPAAAPAADAPVREEAPTTAKEAVRQGLDLVKEVPDDSKWGPQARYLEGLLQYLDATLDNRAPQESVEDFLKVVRMLNPREGSRLDPALREAGFLSLARIHYGARQFDRSAYYYDMIDRDSESWLTALFEASWAYYRRGDYEKALGNLLTLHAPFFEKEYFPESQIVKAIIYFEACRYGETRELVDGFLDRYAKVMEEIEKVAASDESSEQLYARIKTLRSLSTEKEDETTVRIVNLALANPEIGRAQEVVKQVEEEIALWNEMPDNFRTGKLGRDLLDELKQLAIDKERAAGEVTRTKFEEELYALKGLLAQAYRIKIEVVRAERQTIEAKMRGEDTGDQIIPAQARTVVDDQHFYWPYEGEYWRDELGTYQLDFSMCRPVASR